MFDAWWWTKWRSFGFDLSEKDLEWKFAHVETKRLNECCLVCRHLYSGTGGWGRRGGGGPLLASRLLLS